jgi:hypothetical protein
MWNWLERDITIDRSHVDMLRQVRVTENSDDLIVSRVGRLSGVLAETSDVAADDWTNMAGGEAQKAETKEMEVEA